MMMMMMMMIIWSRRHNKCTLSQSVDKNIHTNYAIVDKIYIILIRLSLQT